MLKNSHMLIACEVFRPELEYLSKDMQNPPKIIFLRQGLHDVPDIMRTEVQAEIDKLEEEFSPKSIGLAYGLCGRGITDVSTKNALLIIPKVHDCIPVILGSGIDKALRPEEFSKTYWLSAGWINYCELEFITKREEKYKKYIEDYGQDSADYLMSVEQSWKENYTDVTLIRWDELYNEQLAKDGKYIANDKNLPYKEIQGKSWFVKEMLNGGINKENFFHIYPGNTIDIDENGMISTRTLTK